MPDRDALKGLQIVVWGNTTEVAGPVTISFGDGTPDETPAFNINSQSYIATTHTYTTALVEEDFTFTLTVGGSSASATITVIDGAALTASQLEDQQINNAIEDGLRYQYFSVDSREVRHDAGWSSASWASHSSYTARAFARSTAMSPKLSPGSAARTLTFWCQQCMPEIGSGWTGNVMFWCTPLSLHQPGPPPVDTSPTRRHFHASPSIVISTGALPHGEARSLSFARCQRPRWWLQDRDGGQSQFVEQDVTLQQNCSLSPLLDWVREHLSEAHTVESLASRADLSPRTFARRFRRVIGAAPHRWLTRERVFRAQELLEETTASIDRIAESAGFGSAQVLRLHFRRHLSTTPTAYRKTFQHSSGSERE